MSQPVRTCLGCRQKADKADLLRLVWTPSGLVADVPQRELGRGAYLHFRAECLEQAARRRAVGRALRVEGVTADQLERAARDLIQAAAT